VFVSTRLFRGSFVPRLKVVSESTTYIAVLYLASTKARRVQRRLDPAALCCISCTSSAQIQPTVNAAAMARHDSLQSWGNELTPADTAAAEDWEMDAESEEEDVREADGDVEGCEDGELVGVDGAVWIENAAEDWARAVCGSVCV
jgi:hypothetical protein